MESKVATMQTVMGCICILLVFLPWSTEAARRMGNPAGQEGPPQGIVTCKCPRVFKPVCSRSGTKLGNNQCLAECAGHSSDSFDASWCDKSQYLVVKGPEEEEEERSNAAPVAPPTGAGFKTCSCSSEGPQVCDVWGNVVAANICEAEFCRGLEWGTFSSTWCGKQVSEPTVVRSTCDCPEGGQPVCDPSGNIVASSRCEAESCRDLVWGSFDEAWCTPAATPFLECGCPEGEQPVCDPSGNIVATSRCEAECEGLPWGSFSEEWCASNQTDVEFPVVCDCPDGEDPVCGPSGNVVARSRCVAEECLYLPWGSFAEGWCDQSKEDEVVFPECPCPEENQPVCDERGNVVARSWCEAETCLGLLWGSFALEWCSLADSPQFPENDCDCPDRGAPVCDWDGNVVAGNRCKARCLQLTPGTYAAEWCGNEGDDSSSAFETDEQKGNATLAQCDCPPGGRPVCNTRGDVLAASRCEAEQCLDLLWGTFSEEWCDEVLSGPQFPDSSCNCSAGGAPVCDWDGTVVAENQCKARCLQLTPGTYAAEWCGIEGDDTADVRREEDQNGSKREGCDCPGEGRPVCNTRGDVLASSRCEAEQCLDLHWGTFSEEWCDDDGAAPEFPDSCGCPDDGAPVCNWDGVVVAGNECKARCLELSVATYAAEWCGNEGDDSEGHHGGDDVGVALSPAEPCDCPDGGRPVCDTDGVVLARSRCEARKCLGLDWGVYAENWCKDTVKVEFPECDCSDKYKPVCDSNGREVAHNACIAKKCFKLLWGSYNRRWCLTYEHNNAASATSSAGSSVHSSSSAFDRSSSADVSSSETSSEEPSSSGYWKWHSSSDGATSGPDVDLTPLPPADLDEAEELALLDLFEEIDAPTPAASEDDLFDEGMERRGLMELQGSDPPTDSYAALGSIWGRDAEEIRELFAQDETDDTPAPSAK